jgi:predicted RNA binding protein YcfA (HicA-like mRNA interferase family)
MTMRGRDVAREITKRGGGEVRKGKGSHVRFTCACGKHLTTVMVGKVIVIGTLKAIQEDLEGCASFGKGWLQV